VPLMLTGGFRTGQGMTDAVDSGAVDVVGLARPITYEPDLPRRLLDGTAEKSLVTPKSLGPKVVDDLLNSAWHRQQLARLGRGRVVRPNRGSVTALAIALLTSARTSCFPGWHPAEKQRNLRCARGCAGLLECPRCAGTVRQRGARRVSAVGSHLHFTTRSYWASSAAAGGSRRATSATPAG
jgi:hypothetical protein